jgi:CobQ-like glutamine amidotransferase family enzyme
VITIGHLYPELLNLYGDRGNIITLVRRLAWRGLPVRVREIKMGDQVDLSSVDILFLGGGSDREQGIITTDLERRASDLGRAIEKGLVILAICGGYQLLGKFYRTLDGREIPGLGLIDFHTIAGTKRLVGNIAIEIRLGDKPIRAAGFENHSGQTFIAGLSPLGRVLRGFGNNGADKGEGLRYRNVFGTYLHGPLLPKNPELADHLIGLALQRQGVSGNLDPLDDSFEHRATETMLKRLGLGK